jgi:hypothetical protein
MCLSGTHAATEGDESDHRGPLPSERCATCGLHGFAGRSTPARARERRRSSGCAHGKRREDNRCLKPSQHGISGRDVF